LFKCKTVKGSIKFAVVTSKIVTPLTVKMSLRVELLKLYAIFDRMPPTSPTVAITSLALDPSKITLLPASLRVMRFEPVPSLRLKNRASVPDAGYLSISAYTVNSW